MLEIRKTELFANWLDSLRDVRARARVQVRIERLATGIPGDVQPVREGVPNCGSTTVPVTGCTSKKLEVKYSFCSQEETSVLRTRI